jgi:hypothetical protein
MTSLCKHSILLPEKHPLLSVCRIAPKQPKQVHTNTILDKASIHDAVSFAAGKDIAATRPIDTSPDATMQRALAKTNTISPQQKRSLIIALSLLMVLLV